MTTYASVPAYADHKLHPRVLLLIVAGHAAAITALMMARMTITDIRPPRTIIESFPLPAPPPPHPIPPQPKAHPQRRVQPTIDHAQPVEPTQLHAGPVADNTSTIPNLTPTNPRPVLPLVPAERARTGPRFATPQSELKPPYPEAKLLAQEEATLRLKLTIDALGRVTAVDPVGPADPAFLASARRHIIAHWRYQPATEDGRPVPSSTVITLQFLLDS